MQILIVTASLPYPPASGGAIRVFGILSGLHEAGHTITLLSFGNPDADYAPLRDLCQQVHVFPPPERSTRERVLTLLTTQQADIETRFYDDAFAQKLLTLMSEHEFDLVQFEAIESASYLPLVREQFPHMPICFDTFNAEADLQRMICQIDRQDLSRLPHAFYSWIQSRRIAQYEGMLCRMADLVIAVSPEDHALLSQYRADERTTILHSGIFVKDYAEAQTDIHYEQPTLIFTGKMDYRPNVDAMLWFADHILPSVPEAQLVIVGQKPHPRIQHLTERPNIQLTGWVDRIPPYLHAGDVYVAPLRMGSGTRLKILEAMASSCAIVATSIAVSGLSDRTKDALVIADDEADFAEAIRQLLANPQHRQALGEQAREAVAQHYDWSVLIPQLLTAYQEVGIG
ncbi:MAG: glycosyltransferase [Anaerolineae bacterium]